MSEKGMVGGLFTQFFNPVLHQKQAYLKESIF